MQSINLAWFVRLSNALRPLVTGDYNAESAPVTLGVARGFLLTLGDKSSFPFSIDASRPSIWELFDLVDGIIGKSPADRELTELKASIAELASQLSFLLDADLAHQPAFHVFPKRAYDVAILTTDTTQIFSKDVRDALSEEESFNIREAGRCLAFEVPTAAAFHIFRCLDSVLQRYVVSRSGRRPKSRNWGSYIKQLEESGTDEKITAIITHIKDHYRNPIIHPDDRIDTEQALSLIGIAESATNLMTSDMASRLST